MADLQTLLEWRTAPEKAVRLFHSQPLDKINEALEKQSFNALGELGEYLQLFPSQRYGLPGGPSPLTSMLVGGLTGAGLGYGTGMLAERYLPESWERKRARRTFAALGGLLGAAPGLMWGGTNMLSGDPFLDKTIGTTPAGPIGPNRFQRLDFGPYANKGKHPYMLELGKGIPPEEIGPETKMSGFGRPLAPIDFKPITGEVTGAKVAHSIMEKIGYGMTGMLGMPAKPLDVDEFNDTVWNDPYVSSRLSPPQQAAASGMVMGAANLPGKYSPRFVTPLDMGRMAVGMGSGFTSGAFVGKVLGLLFGMPQESQDRLKQTGMMAGAIANALPLIYG